ncbi:MAG TPA: phosphatidylglycerophosphatase A [Sediminibacterium sp.]|nr:phosphatidylglycerophosphatase A [Sediminibacterium sp.]
MPWIHIASCCGIGRIKGGGTIAAAVTCAICWMAWRAGLPEWLWWLIIAIVLTAGVAAGNHVESIWGKDSSKVVVDEVAGMAISLGFLPRQWNWMFGAFVLFRVLDITKPFYIRQSEKLPGGWGVMADDVIAGVYTLLILQATQRMI